MVTQILPAVSLRSTYRLPAERTLLQAPNYLICWVLWPIRQAIFRVELAFSLLSGRARDIVRPGRQSKTGDQPGDGIRSPDRWAEALACRCRARPSRQPLRKSGRRQRDPEPQKPRGHQ
jgi:hypothetical protein